MALILNVGANELSVTTHVLLCFYQCLLHYIMSISKQVFSIVWKWTDKIQRCLTVLCILVCTNPLFRHTTVSFECMAQSPLNQSKSKHTTNLCVCMSVFFSVSFNLFPVNTCVSSRPLSYNSAWNSIYLFPYIKL